LKNLIDLIFTININRKQKTLYDLYGLKNKKIMEQTIVDTDQLGIEIVAKLKTIYDPEIPVDIYELGLIYDVMVSTDFEVKILMTLTSPNCPVAESLPREVEEKVKSIEHIKDAEVEITFDPPWNKDLMSEEAKLELGML
jgi:FeS assembly SUF system protein